MLKGCMSVLLGLGTGAVVVVLLALMLLGWLASARADELSPYHDHMNSLSTYHDRSQREDIIYVRVMEEPPATHEDRCVDTNNFLKVVKAKTDEYVAQHPEHKKYFVETYVSIDRSWCNE